MRKLIYAMTVLAMMTLLAAPALVRSGRHLGPIGRDAVNQHQVMDPPPSTPKAAGVR